MKYFPNVRKLMVLAALLQLQAVNAAELVTRPNSTIDPDKMEVAEDPEWDTPPKLIKGKSPVFPISLLLSGSSGKVVIQYTIGIDGRTKDFVVKSTPDQKFADHAIIAIRKWIYRPAVTAGAPIETTVQQEFTFTAH
ncbi:TonB family protein [Lysobacter tyrosinilyticus]